MTESLKTDLETRFESIDRFLGTADAAKFFNYSTSHFRYLVRIGKFPPPVRMNSYKMGWRRSVLEAHARALEQKAIAAA
jgi:predicted DNA-binding transcriptional regulator AlpA